MEFELTNERDLAVKVKDDLEIFIPLSQLVVVSEKFGFNKGFISIVKPLLFIVDDTLEFSKKEMSQLKKEIKKILETKVSDLEKEYYLSKHRDLEKND